MTAPELLEVEEEAARRAALEPAGSVETLPAAGEEQEEAGGEAAVPTPDQALMDAVSSYRMRLAKAFSAHTICIHSLRSMLISLPLPT